MAESQLSEAVYDEADEVVRTGLALSTILLELLDEELSVMLSRDAQAIDRMVTRKQQIVDDVRRIEPALLEMLREQSPVDAGSELGRLRALMLECRDKNRRNQTVAITGMRSANQSLTLLRSMLNMDDLALYDAEGAVQVIREKRRLGKL